MGEDPLNDGRVIAAIEDALQILRDDEVELVFLHQGEQVIARRSRVVHENIEPAVGAGHGPDDVLRDRELADVALHGGLIAHARLMPRDAPVTSATLAARLPMRRACETGSDASNNPRTRPGRVLDLGPIV